MYRRSKRLFDIVSSISAILLLWPLMLLIVMCVKATSSGPIFYRGVRAGQFGHRFSILKFRTMVSDAEQLGGFSTSLNDCRLTPVGRRLRRYKLDEIPQFFNVLFGQMSLVGPRPQVFHYTDKYSEEERRILEMKPGITDIASIYFSDMDSVLGEGNVEAKYQEEVEPIKNKLRLKYVDEASFALDFKILFATAFSIFGLGRPFSFETQKK